jgi:hypothetical protein
LHQDFLTGLLVISMRLCFPNPVGPVGQNHEPTTTIQLEMKPFFKYRFADESYTAKINP